MTKILEVAILAIVFEAMGDAFRPYCPKIIKISVLHRSPSGLGRTVLTSGDILVVDEVF